MKIFTPFFACLLLIISSFAQESPELKEASALTESVVKLFNEQKYKEALPLAKRALEIRERLLPRNDPQIGMSLSYLADIYVAKEDHGAARKTLERLLQFETERLGAEDVTLARTLQRLAVLYYRGGDAGKAEEAYKRVLALTEKEYGANDVQVAHSLFNLAEVYRTRRDFSRAAPLYSRALSIYAQDSGVGSSYFERAVESYSCLGYETNRPQIFDDIGSLWKRLAPSGATVAAPPGTVLNGRALSLPQPVYPEAARERRLTGWVVVKVKIDETGSVVSAHDMCQGPPYLSEASVQAAYMARFSPTKLSGKPVPVFGVIQYRFVR